MCVTWWHTSETLLALVALSVECLLQEMGGFGFDPRPQHTKVVKNGTTPYAMFLEGCFSRINML